MKTSGYISSCALTAALFYCSIFPGITLAQTGAINQLDPFAEVSSAQEWTNRFRTEEELDPNDPFNNLTGSEVWRQTWLGQWKTAAENGMSFGEFYDTIQGNAGSSYLLRNPYRFNSAEEHWNAWVEAADGGTTHSLNTLPDWSGDWRGGVRGITGGALVRDYYTGVSETYRPRYIEALQSELEGRAWWPADTCLPNAYGRDGWRFRYIMMNTTQVVFIKDLPITTNRYVFTDERGFLPDEFAFPQWEGESQGIWDGDELIVWTKNIKGWYGGHGQPEYSDSLEIIERWKLISNELVADITLYDPQAFAYPWHDVAVFEQLAPIENWQQNAPTVSECVSTNNTYHDEQGQLAEYSLGDTLYIDVFDPRPWATVFDKANEAKEQEQIPNAEPFVEIPFNTR